VPVFAKNEKDDLAKAEQAGTRGKLSKALAMRRPRAVPLRD